MFGLARNSLVAVLVAVLWTSALTPASAAAQGSYTADPIEIFDCGTIVGPTECDLARKAMNWSYEVVDGKFGKDLIHHNDMADAFRHCTWIGGLAAWIGGNDAYHIGMIHEEAGDRKGQPESERQMDEWNNFVGSGIGDDAVRSGTSDTFGYVLDEYYSRAVNYELYGLDGVKGAYESSL